MARRPLGGLGDDAVRHPERDTRESISLALRFESAHPSQIDPTMNDPTDIPSLEARVTAMRRLGVTKWGDIELGPMPGDTPSDEEAIQRSLKLEQQEKERRKVLRLAASGGPRPAGVRT